MDTQESVTLTETEQLQVQAVVDELLGVLELSGTAEVVLGTDAIEVILDTPDTGIVIGYHGEVLESFQLILSLAVAKKLGRFTPVSVEVGDYKKNRTEYLRNLAQQTKERVISEGRDFSLSNLKAWERKTVHLLLKDDPEVVSESIGEGKERTLIIKPRG